MEIDFVVYHGFVHCGGSVYDRTKDFNKVIWLLDVLDDLGIFQEDIDVNCDS